MNIWSVYTRTRAAGVSCGAAGRGTCGAAGVSVSVSVLCLV